MRVGGIEFVREFHGAREFVLKANGLKILLYPYALLQRGAVFMVHYNVGSRNEGLGYTGSAHFLEHLLFKGSVKFPKDTMPIDKLFARAGAIINANTSYDRTGFFEVVSIEYLDLAMQMEADRMRKATFTDRDRQDEMSVVRNELEMRENDMAEQLYHLVNSISLLEHPYHHPIIGYRADVEGVSTNRIRQFYDEFYHPNNAMIIVVGSIPEIYVLERIKKYFAKIPRSTRAIPTVYTMEPAQKGERRVILNHMSEDMGSILLAWRTPPASHEDIPALCALSYVLSGGYSGLIDQEFVETGRVESAGTHVNCYHDASFTFIRVNMLEQNGHDILEKRIRGFLKTLQENGITEQDVERAKISAEARTLRSRDGCLKIVQELSNSEGAGSWDLYFRIPSAIRNVTPEDILRVFRTYFCDDTLTVGWFVPTSISGGSK
ncbi:MAG: insulinase family protein [Candidatus Spechtbacteria bacterium]|nr:insulinase family protein [Candidatus Spechtbacteria bacterium]